MTTEYRREEFTAGKIVVWILFVVLALAVTLVTAWYGRERIQDSNKSNTSVNSSDTTKPVIAVVNKQRINLRASPGLDGSVILELEQDETLTLLGSPVGPWYNVRRSTGVEGWVHGSGINLK